MAAYRSRGPPARATNPPSPGWYRVLPNVLPDVAGGDPAEGELVELTFPDGSRATQRVVGGRAYLRRVGSTLAAENVRHAEMRRGQGG